MGLSTRGSRRDSLTPSVSNRVPMPGDSTGDPGLSKSGRLKLVEGVP